MNKIPKNDLDIILDLHSVAEMIEIPREETNENILSKFFQKYSEITLLENEQLFKTW